MRVTKSLGELQASFSKGLETIKKEDLKLLNSFTKTKNTLVETSRRSEKARKQTGDMIRVVKVTQSEEQKGKRTKQKNKERAHEGAQLLRQGTEQPWPSRPASRVLSSLPARAHPAARVPPRTVSSSSGVEKEEPKRRPGRLSTKPTPAKVETKPKKATGKDEFYIEKCKQKGKGEQRENGGNGHPRD